MSNDNEQKFFADLQAFFNAVPELASDQKKEDMKKAIGEYSSPDVSGNDPMRLLSPQEAQSLVSIQKKVSPELSNHQFFVRLAQIASLKWSMETQAIFDAGTLLLQREMGLKPERVPNADVLKLVLDAKESYPRYAVSNEESENPNISRVGRSQKRSKVSQKTSWVDALVAAVTWSKAPQKTSGLDAFVAAVKRNW